MTMVSVPAAVGLAAVGLAAATASTATGEAVSAKVAAVVLGATAVTAKLACTIDVAQPGIGARFSAVGGIHVSAALRWRLVGACCWVAGPRF